jgi:transcriptional regulator with XRE-family HTH domain
MLEADQRRLLGEFVRAHRERVRPSAATGRRRTSGLRREELAALAGISVTWCTWIEQGRAVQASPEALARISQALSLSRAEHDYLFKLAGRVDPEGSHGPSADAPPSLIAAVKAIEYPAYGLDRLWKRAAGTKRRRGSFTAGWTAIVNATSCVMCFLSLPLGSSFPTGRTGRDACSPNFAPTSPARFATPRSGYSSRRSEPRAPSLQKRGTSRPSNLAKAGFVCSIILTTVW